MEPEIPLNSVEISSGNAVSSKEDPREIIVEKGLELLKDISVNAKNLSEKIQAFTRRLKQNGELSTAHGLSFLEMRNMMLLTYLMDVASIVQAKSCGKTIENHPAIQRVVESRTVLEKMKPIHFKLKYLIEKLVKAATTNPSKDDVMYLKPNPGNIELMDEDDVEAADETSGMKEKKYVPPKVSAVHYDGEDDIPVEKRKEKMMERAKRRAMSSSLMQELRNEFDDTPEEITEVSVGKKKVNARRLEVEAYEEDNFVRLNPTKKTSKRNDDGLLTMSSLADNVTRFGDLSALDASFGDQDGLEDGSKRKKKRSSVGGKKKKNISIKKKYLKRK